MPKPKYSHRLDEVLMDKAKAKGLNVARLIEAMLVKVLKDKRCPYCGGDR